MLTLSAIIRKAAQDDPDGEPMDVARRLYGSLTKTQLLPALASEIADAQRALVRHHERAAFAAYAGGAKSASSPSKQTIAEYRCVLDRLRGQTFALGDGTRIQWEKATIAQHEQRIAMLKAQVAGKQETIRKHEEVVSLLRGAGANCLEDLEKNAVLGLSRQV